MENIKNSDGLTEEQFLKQYSPGDYDRPSVTTDMIILTVDSTKSLNPKQDDIKKLKVLLIKRKNHPFINKWALPGGFVDINESITDAAYRELKEETNIENVYMEQLFTFGDVERDPRMRVISVSHMALIPKDSVNPVAGDDAEDIAWFSVERTYIYENDNEKCYKLLIYNDDLDIRTEYLVTKSVKTNGKVPIITSNIKIDECSMNNVLAFDHIKQISTALDRLENKIEYTPVAFNLLTDEFTMADVQSLYEALLGRELVKQNFRVKISKFIEKTGNTQKSVSHRPADLYRLKEMKINEVG